MKWLGVRCWKDKISLAVVDVSLDPPGLTFDRRESAPKGIDDIGRICDWFYKVTGEALDETAADGLVLFVSARDVDQSRALFEGACATAAGLRGVPVVLLRKQSTWKPLGVQDAKAPSWAAFLKNDKLFGGLVGDLKEAAAASLAAERRAGA